MPAVQRITPSRGKEFWDALDPDNMNQVLEAVKEEVKLNARPRNTRSNFRSKSVRETRAGTRASLR